MVVKLVGMSFYNVESLIKTLKTVKGIYVPTNHKNNTVKTLTNLRKVFHDDSRDFGELLHHFHFSFMFCCEPDVAYSLRGCNNISISRTETKEQGVDFFIGSATLATWREAVGTCGRRNQSSDLRNLMDLFLKEFDKIGLTPVFTVYERKRDSDKILYLEYKNG